MLRDESGIEAAKLVVREAEAEAAKCIGGRVACPQLQHHRYK